MLRFSHPEYLWFLLLVPIGAIGFYFFNRWQQQKLNTFVSKTIFPLLAPEFSKGKRYLKQALLLLTLACLILTVANPLVGTRLEEVKREGIDLFVTLDVSLSMKAEDIRPNRLEKAKRDVSELLKKLSGDRVGLIVFAGDAFVQFPLTSDYTAADLFLSAIDVDAVPVPGTQIGKAIELALSSFIKESPAQKAIIVVSDGENTEGDFMSTAEDAKRAGVRIYSVGMGTLEGGPIPLYDANGNRADYKRDRKGSIVLSKLDETALRRIAEATGGKYYRATSAGNEIEDIFKEINSLQKAEFGTKQVAGFESRYQYPLACAIFFLLIELMVSERRSKLLNRIKRLLPEVVSLLLIFVCTASGQTVRSLVKEGNRAYKEKRYTDAEVAYKKALEKNPKSDAALYDAGNAYYKEQRYDEALQHYAQAEQLMTSNDQRADAWYNIGNTLYQGNKYQEAVKAYQQSLRYRPGDQEALYNLQMALEKLKQQKNDQQNKQQKNQQQNQQQQNKNQQNQQQNQQQKQQQQQQQQPQLSQKQQMPKEEAERILEAIKNNEKEIQKNLRKREGARVRVEKDW